MRAPIKATVLLAVMVLFSFGLASAQDWPTVYVDMSEVTGLTGEGKIPSGGGDLVIPVRFLNAITNLPGDTLGGFRTAISNGFYFRSDDGVTIGSIAFQKNCDYKWDMECAFMQGCYPWTGCYSWFDMYFGITVLAKGLGGLGVAGLANEGTGLPADFNDIAYSFALTGVAGPDGAKLVLDTTYWEPGNFWLWTAVGDSVLWGGGNNGYVFEFEGGEPPCPAPYTEIYPNPFDIGGLDGERILEIYIFCEDVADVDLASVKVLGKIPCYTNAGLAWIEGDVVVTDVFLMRFLGSGGWRPLPPDDFIGTYTVVYTAGGVEKTLEGDFTMMISQGDVTCDGVTNMDDAIFMVDHLFNGGPTCNIDGQRLDEMMDYDQSGRFDLLDVRALLEGLF